MAIQAASRTSAATARRPVAVLTRLAADGKRCRDSRTYRAALDGQAQTVCFRSDAYAVDHYARLGYAVRWG